MRKAFIFFAAGLAAPMPLMAAAVQQPEAAAQSSQLDARAIVADVRRVISQRYVLPDRRPALDAVLAEGLASGRYDVTDPGLLAERINADLERVGRDRHLGFDYDPQQAAIHAARRSETAPDNSGFERQVRAANHGVTELRVLPGNIRYMAYDGFMWIGPESAAALENAMRFLSGGEAIIIDIRRNGGGDSDASQYLISHFLPPSRPLYTYFREGGTKLSRVSTLTEVPAGRIVDKPLYVLISGSTASAAEEFTGSFAGYRLGELVGENTAGAGFAADLVPIDGRFVLSISIGRVVLASTGRDWEVVGIPPTIRTGVPQALDAAHVHALRRLMAKAPAQEQPGLKALADGIAARLEPRTPALPLTAYAGTFGERAAIAEDGRLYYQRGSGPRTLLIPLGGNRFAFDNNPAAHLEFVVSRNGVSAVALIRPDRSVQGTYERTR
jgi:peptidase S41-like protein